MKTRYKDIEFVLDVGEGKDARWLCHNQEAQCVIGTVEYCGHHKRWEFYPFKNTVLFTERLLNIGDFLEQLSKVPAASVSRSKPAGKETR